MMNPRRLGPFHITRLLGRGGMGAVYEGVHEQSHENVAIKVLLGSLEEDEEIRQRFEAEIDTLKRLRHPNIVQLYGFGDDNDTMYYVMELVHGASLHHELRKGRVFSWQEVAQIAVELCQALKHAHDRGIIHRDIKPANVLSSSNGGVKLSDFGIAQFFGRGHLTETNAVVGTIEYMSPEQAQAEPIGPRSDLYSLGAVLYAMLVGNPPVRAKTLSDLIPSFQNSFKTTRRYPKIADGRADVPIQMVGFIDDLLQVRPDARPVNAYIIGRKFQLLLEEFDSLQSESFTSRTISTKEHIHGHGNHTDDFDVTVSPQSQSQSPSAGVPHSGGSHLPKLALYEDKTQASRSLSNNGPQPPVYSTQQIRANRSSKFTRIAEEDLDNIRGEMATKPPLISLQTIIFVIILLLVGGFVWYMQQPVDADTLHTKIFRRIPTNPDDPRFISFLREAEPNMITFVALYSDDPRVVQIQDFLDELELDRKERLFDRRINGLLATGLHPAERAYLAAVALTRSDPELAVRKFEAIVTLYSMGFRDDVLSDRSSEGSMEKKNRRTVHSATELVLELARRRLQFLKKELAAISAEQTELVRFRLDTADSLDEENPQRAELIRRAVVELYSNAAWAAELVERAKQQMKEATCDTAP